MRKAIVSELPAEFSASRAAAHVIVHYGRGAVTAPLLALADSAGESCVCCACPCLPSIVTSPECPMLRGTNCVRVEEQSIYASLFSSLLVEPMSRECDGRITRQCELYYALPINQHIFDLCGPVCGVGFCEGGVYFSRFDSDKQRCKATSR